ncbi:hypothetical protein [Dyella flagellata]|uniref:hypothetical protein n=1 Tax=Dyella flagellata TaxID=1867833 RepID=UPI0024E06B85|nr:hypothetical protein [Dyella flagellata]
MKPALATESICAEKVSITEISTGAYADDTRYLGVSYIGDSGKAGFIRSELRLNTPEGGVLLTLLEAARQHGYQVTFKRFNRPTCAGEGGEWFDHISSN